MANAARAGASRAETAALASNAASRRDPRSFWRKITAPMKIALVQDNPLIGDLSGNLTRLLERLQASQRSGAQLAVCSELCIPGYPPRDLLDRPAFVDANLRALEELSQLGVDLFREVKTPG